MLLPIKSPYVSGEVSIFDTLVRIGEEKSSITLPLQLHLFLVGCLVGRLRDRWITHHVLAIGLLKSATKSGEQANARFKRTGDAALLLAGLFPERALRLHVSSTYFRHMGQAAYASLSIRYQATGNPEPGRFYNDVAKHFALLEKVLNAMRVQPETEWEAFRRFRASLQ